MEEIARGFVCYVVFEFSDVFITSTMIAAIKLRYFKVNFVFVALLVVISVHELNFLNKWDLN